MNLKQLLLSTSLLLIFMACQKERQNPPLPAPALRALNNNACGSSPTPPSGVCATVPVIVHVIHDGEPEGQGLNVAQASICDQIFSMSQDFNAQNGDLGDIEPMYANLIANANIEFSSAKVIRKQKPASYGDFPITIAEAQDISPKSDAEPLPGVDVKNALHVWISLFHSTIIGRECPLGSWGEHPYQDCNTDGVVIQYNSLGSRVLTHETGHWLGLHHPGGPAGSLSASCSTDDGIYDTPNQNVYTTTHCFANPSEACDPSEPVLYQNFMQGVQQNCRIMFTHGQRAMMLNTLSNYRPGFVNGPCPSDG